MWAIRVSRHIDMLEALERTLAPSSQAAAATAPASQPPPYQQEVLDSRSNLQRLLWPEDRPYLTQDKLHINPPASGIRVPISRGFDKMPESPKVMPNAKGNINFPLPYHDAFQIVKKEHFYQTFTFSTDSVFRLMRNRVAVAVKHGLSHHDEIADHQQFLDLVEPVLRYAENLISASQGGREQWLPVLDALDQYEEWRFRHHWPWAISALGPQQLRCVAMTTVIMQSAGGMAAPKQPGLLIPPLQPLL